MQLKEIKTGNIFNIENTPTYPKLKIDGGYIDIRDEIINRSGNCDDREVEEMSIEDVVEQFKRFGDTKESVEKLLNHLTTK